MAVLPENLSYNERLDKIYELVKENEELKKFNSWQSEEWKQWKEKAIQLHSTIVQKDEVIDVLKKDIVKLEREIYDLQNPLNKK